MDDHPDPDRPVPWWPRMREASGRPLSAASQGAVDLLAGHPQRDGDLDLGGGCSSSSPGCHGRSSGDVFQVGPRVDRDRGRSSRTGPSARERSSPAVGRRRRRGGGEHSGHGGGGGRSTRRRSERPVDLAGFDVVAAAVPSARPGSAGRESAPPSGGVRAGLAESMATNRPQPP